MSNIKEQMDASAEFTKSIKIMGHVSTSRILEAVNNAILSGANPNTIIELLDTLTKFKKN
ncbi:hypothetical protein [Robertmurraya siralis]|uniref:hypothetical protein n=1 Tax=Robertmurraya siralis TaxID=77777 RepID=UPI0010F48AFE|nr:hypothetical protein [Robertmurraya siralis]